MKKSILLYSILFCIGAGEMMFLTGCKKDPELPVVTTYEITDITLSSAKSGGNITSDGGAEVTSRGVCWGISSSPTIEGSYTNDSKGAGTFTSVITLLTPNTVYYVRAYATNKVGTSYGKELSFKTNPILPATLSTSAVTSVTSTTAISGGNISADGGGSITARGVCWHTSPNPTTANSKTVDGSGTGNFVSNLEGLNPGTTYYIRAYAINSAGTAYGNELSFKAAAITPSLTTTGVSGITVNSAISGGNITSDGGAAVTARGVCWGTAPSPEVTGLHTDNSTGTGTFVSNLSGLTPNTKYFVRAYATNSAGTAYGNEISFNTNPIVVPSLTTTTVTGITSSTAVSGGNISDDGGAPVTARGVCWSTSVNPTTSNSKTSDATGPGSFASSLSGLLPGTTYHVRSYAINSAGTAYGNDLTFTTAAVLPAVTTTAASSITFTSAVAGGNVTSTGGSPVTSRGVCWSTSRNPTISGSHTTNGTGAGSFTSNITGLTPSTLYYVRAYAVNSIGIAYGNEISFTSIQVQIPSVSTTPGSNVTLTGAISGGNITNDGGAPITARGVCWGTSSGPVVSGPHSNNGSGSGSFTSNLTGLNQSTLYYVRAYATNSAGTSYGNEIRVTTSASDLDGNVYRTVLIGAQLWMAEDLKTTRFRDNSPVPNVQGNTEWINLTSPGYCWYDNNEAAYRNTYGILYNWYAVGTNNLCPDGWHVPTDGEFKVLELYLGMTQEQVDGYLWRGTDQGTRLKSTTTWYLDGNGNNQSGFTALAGGYRFGMDGGFNNLGTVSYWWSSTEYQSTKGLYRRLDSSSTSVFREGVTKAGGKFVRCLKN